MRQYRIEIRYQRKMDVSPSIFHIAAKHIMDAIDKAEAKMMKRGWTKKFFRTTSATLI